MVQFLGLGLTHYPLLATSDDHMADLLRYTLADPEIPPAEKDPANWPESMRAEWSDDGGTAAAAEHRKTLREHLARCREALDAFAPDLIVVWGDDQYENFREEVIPPFCVLAYPDLQVPAFGVMNSRGAPNAWGLPEDTTIRLRGDRSAGVALVDGLLAEGFDMAYSYRPREGAHFPHAILNTQLFLDYDHAGAAFPYPLLPITVNCYGRHVINRRGALARFADRRSELLDPAAPSPQRCYDLGRAVVRALTANGDDRKIALVASSSWSHAFLVDRLWRLRPDTAADERLYEALVRGDHDAWLAVDGEAIAEAGQQEVLNWYCLLGAVQEAGLRLRWSTFVPTDVFNSNKCFAIYGDEAR
ncbi:MAG: extradiol ring-cleavage dioxygenase [Frankia sp.]|nr:extradiol ring-cleavage dioxygenase [Frankia sp.]